jgi:tetratricopeptide (TPR) repeat protein
LVFLSSLSLATAIYANYEDLDFDKANEILFRLGIIYKQQGKYDDSLTCFDRILRNPPSPLAHADIWFQIGHVYEQQKDVSDPLSCPFSDLISISMFAPRTLMSVSLPTTPATPKSSNN